MVIHSKDLDFSLEFIQSFKDGEQKKIAVLHFVDDIQDWDESLLTYSVIRENVNLQLSFDANDSEATCRMDGFDILQDSLLKYDERNVPFINRGKILLFQHRSGNEYYPYIPGIYCISVVSKGVTYYSLVKVISNRLTDNQLDSMRYEVESQLKGLALDVVRKQTVFQNTEEIQIDNSIFQKYKTLNHHFNEISTIIADLSKRVRSALKKEYLLQPMEKPSHVDSVSIRYRVKHPETTNYLMTKKNKINYDLPENRLLKKIVIKWNGILADFIFQIDNNLEKLQADGADFSSYTSIARRKTLVEELGGYRQRASQMKGTFNQLSVSPWYRKVSDLGPMVIPNEMYIDIRYRKILKIHQYLTSEEFDLSLHPGWRFHWKRTDQLYEIWSFFKVLHLIKENGFSISQAPSWLFNGHEQAGLIVIPTIPKGAIFELQKDDLRLNLVYDGEIPKAQSRTSKEKEPIYTTSDHNTPDIRVDAYIRETFIGSILLDSKYRKKEVLMDSKYQLISYADHVRSPFIYNKRRWERIRPVHRVLVLYPDKWGHKGIEHLNDKSISLVPLTPEMDLEDVNSTLKDLLSGLVLDALDEGVELEEEKKM
ncbi:hypothetical protein JOC95_001927 [Bacillus tianshenii]|uniref:DUF2357 domain-containing protein n=1 Tax=Sutcliffiella tianshenii TaxID=1463404 RepID=A0ABS2P0V9_9BACI|nr:DUF2357 domain-containing protein [Bacillus tianshenii]MBM7620075.1 hypothetical protein [Bacillus tianshenii]